MGANPPSQPKPAEYFVIDYTTNTIRGRATTTEDAFDLAEQFGTETVVTRVVDAPEGV